MSVVRLEITVPDADAHDVANKLAAEYVRAIGSPYASAIVDVRTDADVLRERTILAAARYFLPPE